MKNSVFIDTSAYFALLNKDDPHHFKALKIAETYSHFQPITSSGVLGELLTIGSMKFNKKDAMIYYEVILSNQTHVVIESKELIKKTYSLFQKVASKNISWVDCYSQAIINHYQISEVFTFDKDFLQLREL